MLRNIEIVNTNKGSKDRYFSADLLPYFRKQEKRTTTGDERERPLRRKNVALIEHYAYIVRRVQLCGLYCSSAETLYIYIYIYSRCFQICINNEIDTMDNESIMSMNMCIRPILISLYDKVNCMHAQYHARTKE